MTSTNQGGTSRELPDGFLDVFDVSKLPSTLSNVSIERGGKAVHNIPEKGFLCFGQYKRGYPTIPLKAFFSILIDDNSSNDQNIAILDVYDHNIDRVLGKTVMTRKDFSKAGEFSLFEFDFTPPSENANMEFRIYYMGDSSIIADRIAIIDPSKVSIRDRSDIPDLTSSIPSDYSTGNTIICLPELSQEQIAKYQGISHGGEFGDGWFRPSPNGGLEFTVTIDVGSPFCLEFDLEGNIPNWDKTEDGGGKVSLLTMRETDGEYYLSFQRMDHGYRGDGRFRIILTDRFSTMMESGNTVFHITHPHLAGDYSMANWGDEPHHLQVLLDGSRIQLKIDGYTSKWSRANYEIKGQRRIQLVLGNRDTSAINRGQGALTRFKRMKLYYM